MYFTIFKDRKSKWCILYRGFSYLLRKDWYSLYRWRNEFRYGVCIIDIGVISIAKYMI